MARCFWQIIIGLIVIAVHVSINGTNIVPNGLGYLIVAAGCFGLMDESRRFFYAGIICGLLAVHWVISCVPDLTLPDSFQCLIALSNCLMMWQLLGGMIDFSNSRQRGDLARRTRLLRIVFVISFLISTMTVFAPPHPGIVAIAGFAIIVALVWLVLILLHIHRIKRELA